MDRIAPLFAWYEPLRHAAALVLGMLSTLDRKNCWTIAEFRGYASPRVLQHLLARVKWDVDQARDVLRGYVVEAFADPDAVLVVDETGDLKKGTHSVGVQRQYTGTAGRIENSQVGVFLTYATRRGQVLIDRALYLPRCWVAAGVSDDVEFATKPALAGEMIERAVAVGTPVSWVAADGGVRRRPAVAPSGSAARRGLRAPDRGQPRGAHPGRAGARGHPFPPSSPPTSGSGCPAPPAAKANVSTRGPGSPCSPRTPTIMGGTTC